MSFLLGEAFELRSKSTEPILSVFEDDEDKILEAVSYPAAVGTCHELDSMEGDVIKFDHSLCKWLLLSLALLVWYGHIDDG